MIDTHTHLYMTDSFPDGGEAAVCNAVKEGVDMMVLPGVDIESVEPIIRLHEACREHTAIALGLHPTEVEADWRAELRNIMDYAEDIPIVAVGEAGIDLHWEQSNLSRQMDAFGEQIQIALDRGLPVIVHSRDAVEPTAEVINNFREAQPQFIFHSFTAGKNDAERLLEVAPDALFGINGVITFKNAGPLREAVEWLDINRIITETDAPFLAPVPHRGKTNESAFIPIIVKAIAEIKGLPVEDVEKLTTATGKAVFKL